MIEALAHFLLTTALLQIAPIDARDFEYRLLGKETTPPVSLYHALSYSGAHLPKAKDNEKAPVKQRPNSIGVVTTAVSALVVDRVSGEVLFQKNINEPRSIGSITKLMTAHVFLQSGVSLDDQVSLLPEDLRYGGVQHLAFGETYSIRDILYASLVSSDNTATAALARLSHLSSGDFVARMNEEAAVMGMSQTQFVDPTGLSSKNQSVVADLARLIDESANNETIRTITQTHQISIAGSSGRLYPLENTDELLTSFVNEPPFKIETAKTGYLPEAGYCLSVLFSKEGKREIIVVVLGSESDAGRFKDVKALAAWAYETFEWNT